jgi:OmpA-OmpF porin, OOP family
MKTTKLFLVSSTLAASLFANTTELEVSPYVGGHFFNNNRDMKNSAEGGVIVEKAIMDNGISLAGALGYTQTKSKSTDETKKLGTYAVDLIKNFETGTKLTPYIGAGVGGTFNDNAAMGPNALVGLKYKLTDALNLRAELSDNYLLNGKNDVKAILGLGFLFGGTKAQVAPVEKTVVKQEPQKVVESPKEVKQEPKKVQKVPVKEVNLQINFDNNKAVVKETYKSKLEEFAKFMNENKEYSVTIEGYTDNTASKKYNQKLSEKRANAVRDILIKEYKVDADRIKAVGYGAAKPIADNKTKEGKTQNRRIVAVLAK